MSGSWYYSKSGRIHGPITRTELDERYSRGEVGNTDQVRLEAGGRWIPYGETLCRSTHDNVEATSAMPIPRRSGEIHVSAATRTEVIDASRGTPFQASPSWLSAVRVHPLIALCVIAFDFMIFGGEAATGGLGVVCLAPLAGAVVFVATMLVQRHTCRDSWGAATGKALLLGTLTAIPTPLPSFVTAALGGMGYLARRPTT